MISLIVLLILVHNYWVEVSFFFLGTSGLGYIPTMTSVKGRVTFSCAAGRFESGMKAASDNLSYMLFLLALGILAVEYF